MFAQVIEDLRVPEELRDLDQEAVDEPSVLLGIGLQIGRVVGQRWTRSSIHPAVQSPQDRARLVAPEVDTASLVDPLEEVVKLVFIGPLRWSITGRQEIEQDRSDRVDVGCRVDQGR